MLMMTIKANTNSTLLRALKTNLPMPNPKGTLIPGARNLSQASIKLMAQTNPIHRKVQIRAMGIFTTVIAMELKDYFCSIRFLNETFLPFVVLAISFVLLFHLQNFHPPFRKKDLTID